MKDDPTNSVETALATLQPIRDLAKNWDIDIAACLEDYLHDLIGDLTEEERRNLPPQHAETLNFSQAALVLQNSSNVYSRKVEYLYSLVYKTLDELIQNSGNKSPTAANCASKKVIVDAAIEEFNSFDPHVEFLLLDDVLPTDTEGKRINLQEGNGDEDPTTRQGHGLSFATNATNTRLSLGITGTSNLERSNITTAAAHSATQHVLRGSLDTGCLRLLDGRCDVGEDGILIMPGAGKPSLVSKIRPSSTASENFSPRNFDAVHSSHDGSRKADNNGDVDGRHIDDFMDHDNDGDGFVFADDEECEQQTANSPDHKNKSYPPSQHVQSLNNAHNPANLMKDDPWVLLDPHCHRASSSSLRPLRIGKTCKLPPTLTQLPSECVTGARTKKTRILNATVLGINRYRLANSFASETFKSRLNAQRAQSAVGGEDGENNMDVAMTIPRIPMKGSVFGDEFLYIAKETAKRKTAQKREDRKKIHLKFPHDFDSEYEEAYGATVDYGDGDDYSAGGFYGNYDDNNGSAVGNNGMASVDEIFHPDLDEPDETSRGTKTFEELCRAHIQAFAKGAEAYAAETHLTRRVGDWHDKLLPILNEEENRPEFDIHQYTQRVVNAIQTECKRLSTDKKIKGIPDQKAVDSIGFGAVTRDCQHYDVCRLFLASLSLCNSENVEILFDKEEQSLRMKLLRKTIGRPMETYLAPSVLEHDT